jgi:hypothetical protein
LGLLAFSIDILPVPVINPFQQRSLNITLHIPVLLKEVNKKICQRNRTFVFAFYIFLNLIRHPLVTKYLKLCSLAYYRDCLKIFLFLGFFFVSFSSSTLKQKKKEKEDRNEDFILLF